MKKLKKTLFVAVLIIAIIVILFFVRASQKSIKIPLLSPSITPIVSQPSYSDVLQPVFWIDETPILITKTKIWINYEGSETSVPAYTIDKKDYPDLFQDESRISLKIISDTRNSQKYAVFSRENYSRGGFSPYYFVVFNLTSHKVVYSSPDTFSSWFSSFDFSTDGSEISLWSQPFWFNSIVTNDSLPIAEFVKYDPAEGKFVLSNNRHLEAFKQLKQRYDKAADNCYFYRKLMSAEDILFWFGGNAKCDDYIIPDKPEFNSNKVFLPVGKFELIRSTLSKIISGENIPMIPNTFDSYKPQKGDMETYFSQKDQVTAVENSKKEKLFSQHPELTDYVKGHYVYLVDMVDWKSGSDSAVIFQSYPVGCGSCGTRSVDYLYKGLIKQIDAGHEIHHQIITNSDGSQLLSIKYGLLNGEGNSDYQWSLVKEYKWDNEKKEFVKVSETKVPSPYSKQ